MLLGEGCEVASFRLEIREFHDLTRWRWVLTGFDGTLVADHQVRLDAGSWQFEAFTDLRRYLRWHVAPDRRVEDETRIVAQVGEWIGTQVFGPVGAALVGARPATVRVVVPSVPMTARSMLLWPLELAHVQGQPLALQEVTMVMQLVEGSGAAKTDGETANIGARLRVLGLFSLPTGSAALNLRQERHALVSLLSGLAAEGRATDAQILQYGVTRTRLRNVLEEDEGWDVIHISGHGSPGELLFESEDGSPDPVNAAELAELLEAARGRIKLVTLSACWSAALTAAGQRQLLGLPLSGGQVARPEAGNTDQGANGAEAAGNEESPAQGDGFGAGTLATELVGRLGCAVLAMRYPVADTFAATLTSTLYGLLADKGQPVPQALGIALSQTVAKLPRFLCPPLSAATPALFGERAVGLKLAAPYRTQAESNDAQLKMTGFPPQPERFVGRTAVMARANAALATKSGIPGVLLYGMPGGGKSACALELAYTHEHAFDRLVWFKAPDEGCDITGALTDFALTLERELPSFQMIHVLPDEGRFTAFLPRLAELTEQRRVLIVIDNIESLLTEGGQWRDARWGQVLGALSARTGLGRVILTSRRLPPDMTGLRIESVDALSLDEALLLARELSHLGALIQGELPGIQRHIARTLALGVLNIAQGHPKLLELADGQAASPEGLAALVQAGDQVWQQAGGLPAGFFTIGESRASTEDYLHVLSAWTAVVSEGLTPGQRTLFWFLCCLEEGDRIRPVTRSNWMDLWNRLRLDGQPPDLDESLAAIAVKGLAAIAPETDGALELYDIHPGVAAAGRARAGKGFQDAVDTELAAYWNESVNFALEREGQRRTSGLVVRAGLAAVPYLMRQGQWSNAGTRLLEAFNRNKSRQTAAAILPAMQTIVANGNDPGDVFALARVLELIDPAASERQARAALDAAVERDDSFSASVATLHLIVYCYRSGRLAEALTLIDRHIEYIRRAGLGPWTEVLAETWRLRTLNAMGHAEHVLAEVQRLRAHLTTLPVSAAEIQEIALPFDVREGLFNIGYSAAVQLSRWQDALELNAAAVVSLRDRGASAAEMVTALFNHCGPLIKLGQGDEALTLLLECRRIYENARDIDGLAKVILTLADLEYERGHGDVAINLQRDGLRYSYLAGDVKTIAAACMNHGTTLLRHERQPGPALAHHLATALIGALTGGEGVGRAIYWAATDLRSPGGSATVPKDIEDLCVQLAADIPEADLKALITALCPDPRTIQQTFQELLTRVRAEAAAQVARLSPYLAWWDPFIAALLAFDSGDEQAGAALDAELVRYQDSDQWVALVAVLRRLRAGGTSPELFTGLVEVHAAIAARALDAREGTITIPVQLWYAMGIGSLLSDLVAGAAGSADAAGRAREMLDEIAELPELPPLTAALGRILDGDRGPGMVDQVDHPVHKAVVETILRHIGLE